MCCDQNTFGAFEAPNHIHRGAVGVDAEGSLAFEGPEQLAEIFQGS